ncbi:hypothetical protein [Streptomyces sp. CA-251247]|uniref:hypothetical protein n=1 Tax=Streptomyces sp. CA-251247 TaxID=3240062 RepID=UPI003D8A63FA
MASSSAPWTGNKPRRLHAPLDLDTPKSTPLPGTTPKWPGHEYGSTLVPAKDPSTPGLPGNVRRSRAELESLRDDAARQFHTGADAQLHREIDVRRPAAAAEGVWAVASWLLGEVLYAPLSGERYEYPYTERQVGLERTHARDCIEGNDWPDVDADYAAGVRYTVGWAIWPDEERPVPAA